VDSPARPPVPGGNLGIWVSGYLGSLPIRAAWRKPADSPTILPTPAKWSARKETPVPHKAVRGLPEGKEAVW